MPITHTNRKGVTYYLHIDKTRTGKDRYYFSPSREGTLAKAMPFGHEVYENMGGQVFLVRMDDNPIPRSESDAVQEEIDKRSDAGRFRVEARKGVITIHESAVDEDEIALMMGKIMGKFEAFMRQPSPERGHHADTGRFSPVLRFVLMDAKRRTYSAQHMGIDDWLDVGKSGTVDKLAARYVGKIGRRSFSEM